MKIKTLLHVIVAVFSTLETSSRYTEKEYDIPRIFVRKGGQTVLQCELPKTPFQDPPPPHVIQWFRDKVAVFVKVGKHLPHTDAQFEGRMSLVDEGRNASLRIKNVTLEDEGVYRCQVLFLRESISSNGTYVYLIVTDSPTFVMHPPAEKIVRQGESMLLRCGATGRPQPAITWWKNGHPIRNGEAGILLSHGSASELAVKKLNVSHGGVYTCQAQSVVGTVDFATLVKVEAPPEFIKKPVDHRVQEELNASFNCKATGFPKVIRYKWYYNNVDVETPACRLHGRYKILTDGSLVIYTVVAKDKGNLTCVPENGRLPYPKATASLTVLFRARVHDMPNFVFAGNGLKATLTCPTDAEPAVTKVIWKKGGAVINVDQNPRMYLDKNYSLIISPVTFSDAERYTCTPSNEIGTAGESTGTNLRIHKPPHFIEKPRDVYEAEIGKRLTIPCRGGGKPPPNVLWRKKHDAEETVQFYTVGGTLSVEPVTKHIHGLWQCVLKNSVAEVTTDVKILVKYTMPHKIKNITVQPFSDTALRVAWIPGYDGGYQQYFMIWYRQTGTVDPSWETHQPNRSDNVMILGNLQPDTLYEIAVLPVNKIRSGPFSDNVTARTKAPRSVSSSRKSTVPRPYALFASTTSNGLVQLSWKKPNMVIRSYLQTAKTKLLGFFIEYRWIGITAAPSQIGRTKRDTHNQHDPMPARGRWSTLKSTYENVTSVLIQPNQLYRDVEYEFRALAATESEYSEPSAPVSFTTAGLVAYPCYSGMISSANSLSQPLLIGVIIAVTLVLILLLLILWYCCYRKNRKLKEARYVSTKTVDESQHGATMNGNVLQNSHSIVVDLTEKRDGGMNRIDLELTDSAGDDDGIETPFLQRSKMDDATAVFDAFVQKHNSHLDTDSRKETLSSDRSSVRLRREATAKVLLEQYKRRSLTDQTHHRLFRDLRFRGGTRSASTSPERPLQKRCDHANLTSSFDSKGKPRIKLYSRKIDETGKGQQRRMIIMKRKSQKTSKFEQPQKDSISGLASDSSESPVFAVVGTLKQRFQGSDKRASVSNSPSKSMHSYNKQDRFGSPYDDSKTDHCDVTGRDFLSPPISPASPQFEPVYSSSPKDYISSPDVSPNRVKARRTVQYDPDDNCTPIHRSSSKSPTKRDHRSSKSHSLTYEQRTMYKSHYARKDFQNQSYCYPARHDNELFAQQNPDVWEHGNDPGYYVNPGYHVTNSVQPRSRYSFAAHRSVQAVPPRQQYHPNLSARELHNARARSRASYSFGHRHHSSVYSPGPSYEKPLSTSLGIPSTSRSAHPSSSDPLTPKSTCEIDCSNSDIEVRFFKDADGNEFSSMLSHDRLGRGETTASVSQATETTAVTSNSVIPTSGGNMNLSHQEQPSGHFFSSNTRHPLQQRISTSPLDRATSPRHISSHSTRQRPSTSTNHYASPHANASNSGNAQATVPSGAIGSSDYGSQDMSNSSTSPRLQQSPFSPQPRFSAHERPSRKDNSSVEDNYEWDSEIAMENEIVEALRHFGTLKKSGPVSDELLDELNKITRATQSRDRQRAQSADILDSHTTAVDEDPSPLSPRLTYSQESMARRCAALRAEFLHYQRLQKWEEDGVT